MSLQPRPINPVPEQTARVARAAFRKGNVFIRMRDELGTSTRTSPSRTCFRREANQPRLRGGSHLSQ